MGGAERSHIKNVPAAAPATARSTNRVREVACIGILT